MQFYTMSLDRCIKINVFKLNGPISNRIKQEKLILKNKQHVLFS